MARYGIICDVEKCTGCHACVLACKDEFVGNGYLPLSACQSEGQKWMTIREVEYGSGSKVKVEYIPLMCQHCDRPFCVEAALDGAVYKRDDGIVIIDPVKAKGQKQIADSCPYGVIFWNETLQLPQKCTLCAHMLDKGEQKPRCVECCPTEALIFGDLDDSGSEIAKLEAERDGGLETYKPEFGTKPAVRYLSLPKPFIAGEVVRSDRPEECCANAKVFLSTGPSGQTLETATNFLGDFEFKQLSFNTRYLLTVKAEGTRLNSSHP